MVTPTDHDPSKRLLAAPLDADERSIEVSMYAFKLDADQSSRPVEPGEAPDGYCVYVLEYEAGLGDENTELFDKDFASKQAAVAAFNAQLEAFPSAGENVFAMPHPADETLTQLLLNGAA